MLPYLGIDCKELKGHNFLNSNDGIDKEKFSVLKPRLIDFE